MGDCVTRDSELQVCQLAVRSWNKEASTHCVLGVSECLPEQYEAAKFFWTDKMIFPDTGPQHRLAAIIEPRQSPLSNLRLRGIHER